MLASSFLLAGLQNPAAQGAPAPYGASPATNGVSQLYSQFQNFFQASNGDGGVPPPQPSLFPGLFPPPPLPTATPSSLATVTSESNVLKAAAQMPNLVASLLRNRSGSLSRRYSAPDLQKLGTSAENSALNASAGISADANIVTKLEFCDSAAVTQPRDIPMPQRVSFSR